MPNVDYEAVKVGLSRVFAEMHVEVPSDETDLFDSGILDSQRLVELLFQIEQNFDTQVNVDDFEIENFRCIETITRLILDHRNAAKLPQLSKVGGSPN
jgi:acyl carrier protein